ncbi:MAG TPA: BCAM0308 family protein [Nitrospiria bacterium]|nr:BCAM0308 family protein [Nitrospiria bacterium]
MRLRAKNRGRREPRKERVLHWLGLQREFVHDTYKLRGKLPEPTVCSRCGAVYHRGHWSWSIRPVKAHEAICPACRRIADNYPAGSLRLSGPFLRTHREELLNAIRHQEREEKREHPLSRLIGIKESKDGVTVTTTDMHLPRRIGEALWHAYHGELKLHYAEDARLLRVSWKR